MFNLIWIFLGHILIEKIIKNMENQFLNLIKFFHTEHD